MPSPALVLSEDDRAELVSWTRSRTLPASRVERARIVLAVAERRTGLTWHRIATELNRVHAVTLAGTAGSVVHTTPLTTVQAGIVAACHVSPPAVVTALDPV